MALMQISEPGQSPNPHQRRLAVGIDLGTTHSLVAAVRHGVPECRVLLPSVVHYPAQGGRRIGWAAQEGAVLDAANTVASAKRLMGRGLADIDHQDKLPYALRQQPGMVAVATAQGDKSPVEVSAEILATLRQRAEDTLGGALDGRTVRHRVGKGNAQFQDVGAVFNQTVHQRKRGIEIGIAYGEIGNQGFCAVKRGKGWLDSAHLDFSFP